MVVNKSNSFCNFLAIGVPTFRDNTGKVECWYYDAALSAHTASTAYSGWMLVSKTNNDTYDGLSGTNTLSADVKLGRNVSIQGNDVLIASTSGFSPSAIFEYDMLYKGNLQPLRFISTNNVKMKKSI